MFEVDGPASLGDIAPLIPFPNLQPSPLDTPADAVDPLMWREATRVWCAHQVDPLLSERRCSLCRQSWPCEAHVLAERGLLSASPGSSGSVRLADPPVPFAPFPTLGI